MSAVPIDYLQLVTRHQASIYGYIRSLAPGANIEDILQETNIVLWEKAATFERGTNFKAFAFRIAHLKTLEALRSEKRRRWLVFDSDLLESIAETRASAEATLPGQQSALRGCLERLDAGDRQLIHGRYSMRKSVRDLAREDGRSEGALQQVFFRLRHALRRCIEQQLATEGGGA